MPDYKEKFGEWQKTTKEKLEEIDKGLRDKLEESAKAILETAQKSAETIKEGVEALKTEAEKTEVGKQAIKTAEELAKTASEKAKVAWEASEPIRQVAEEIGEKTEETLKNVGKKASEAFSSATEKAEEVLNKTKDKFSTATERISKGVNYGAAWTRTFDATTEAAKKAVEWIGENPLNAALTGLSLVVGAGLGAGMTLISSHWLFNSAIPSWSVKEISKRFLEHIENQEELLAKGELSEAEAKRIEFEKEIAKQIGAPLLGAFSFGAGAMMWANIFSPKTITGVPINWILRGNPILQGAWFFGNGLVCFKIGYEFFMFALKDQTEVETLINQLKGLLPQTD
jgi:ElaB/YqjD/DUF883 family membrane-anchored ribosome-binding protein